MTQRILLISDIGFQIDHFRNLFKQHNCAEFAALTVHCSPGGEAELAAQNPPVKALEVKENVKVILQSFDLILLLGLQLKMCFLLKLNKRRG